MYETKARIKDAILSRPMGYRQWLAGWQWLNSEWHYFRLTAERRAIARAIGGIKAATSQFHNLGKTTREATRQFDNFRMTV